MIVIFIPVGCLTFLIGFTRRFIDMPIQQVEEMSERRLW